MRTFFILLIFSTFSNLTFGQKIYQADREAYKSNKFVYEFYLFNDSTCFLKGHYFDNAIYFLYKGQLKKTKDTLYEFKFQPIVNFGCNKRFHYRSDSVRFSINQIDTVISSLNYKVKPASCKETSIGLKIGWTSILVKGTRTEDFSVNTNFVDPLTKKLIYLTVRTSSEPYLTTME